MQNKKNSAASTMAFGVLVVLICVFYAFYSQISTASALFSICFERSDSDTLLAQDADWYGSDELRQMQDESVQRGLDALAELEHSSFDFTTSTAGSLFIRGDTGLSADYYDAGSSKTAVLLHAYGRSRDFAARWADFWIGHGYNVLIPQMRGHDGNDSLTTLGFYEQYDLCDLLCAAAAETGVHTYALHGEGLGANAALLMCGNADLMDRLQNGTASGITVGLVVAEGASTDMMTLITHQAARQFEMRGMISRLAMKFSLNQKLGFSPDSMDITAAAAGSDTPTVFVCGMDDGFSPDDWTQTLYDSCTAEKELLIADGVSHSAAWERAGEAYRAAVEKLLP